jgi:hypothetical protein
VWDGLTPAAKGLAGRPASTAEWCRVWAGGFLGVADVQMTLWAGARRCSKDG